MYAESHMARRLWRIAKRTLLVMLALAMMALASVYVHRTSRLRQIAAATVIDPVSGIDEELFARIGGIEQWIGIRGRNRDNPVVLLLHGGPGMASSVLPRDYFFSWTRDFTVVRWDQRGAGRTYGRSGPVAPGMTIERMAQDGIEVVEFLRAKLHKPKIILIGLSWGSMLGATIAHARPDLLYAYVGTGQAVNQGKYKKIAYEQLLAEAARRRNQQAIRELTAIGPPPWDEGRKEGVHTKWATSFEPGQPSFWQGASMVLFESPDGPMDFVDFVRGLLSSDEYFRDQVKLLDIPSFGTDFAIPFFVFQGAEDNVTPIAPVRDYVASLHAPNKELVLIPNAGHSAIVTRSDEFLKLLVERVRPFAAPP
jgi:pimeloyl-ACP methyl ester carboxylesterase